MTQYYDEKIECISNEELKKLQLKLFNQQLKRANRAKAYQGRLPNQIKSLADIKNIPFTTKEDLRKNSPYGYLAVPTQEIVRTCATSGTTGTPIFIFFTKGDLESFATSKARHYFCSGLYKNEAVQCMLNLNLSSGNLCHLACEKIGVNFIPSGTGNTLRQLDLLEKLGAGCCFTTPNYLLHLCTLSKEMNKRISLNSAIVLGEPCSSLLKKKMLSEFGIEIFDNYGSTEMEGGVAAECSFHNGLHVEEDYYYIEIVDPETGENLPDGQYGELVITPLQQEAMPFIRYRTRDITRVIPDKCPCGRTHRRIEPITHRIDDMIIINGTNVYPSQIEECLYKNLPLSNYLIHIIENKGIKRIVIDVELSCDLLRNDDKLKKIEKELTFGLKAYITVTPKLNFIPVGTLPEISGKVKRVVKE